MISEFYQLSERLGRLIPEADLGVAERPPRVGPGSSISAWVQVGETPIDCECASANYGPDLSLKTERDAIAAVRAELQKIIARLEGKAA
jgi:hypothetical protein